MAAKSHGSFARKDDSFKHYSVDKDDAAGGPSLIKRTKEMRYASLHHHSTFSFLDGFGLPEAHVRRAGELGMGSLALTEHGNVSSHVKLEQAALKEGIKPIFGCELYTGDISEEKRTQRKNHLTVLAANAEGYRNLLRLVSEGWDEGFYYEPTVSPGMLRDRKDGLVILSGCQGSLLATSLVGGKNVSEDDASYARAKRVAQAFRRELGDAYYLEVQAFPELERTKTINQGFEQLARELGIPLVATGDCHYTRPTEAEMQMILHNVRPGEKRTLEEMANSWGYDVPLAPPPDDKVMYHKLRGTGLSHKAALEAIYNSQEIAQRCNVTLPKLERLRYPLPRGYKDTKEVWLEQLRMGWAYRGIDRKSNVMEYRRRLKYERSIIEEKDFVDYFLVVGDLVRFAKDSGIPVGPARGSAAASLVCYLLRITEVDPLRFANLVFERFIDLTRQDLPDIDLDFDSERRGEIRDYCVGKYGREKVGNIGNFVSYKSKLALDDVARVHHVPQWEVDKIKELLIERSSGDLRASATIEDTVEYFEAAGEVVKKYPVLKKAYDLEGNYKGMGVHAAGLVVANGPLTNVAAVYTKKIGKQQEKTQVISTDKVDSEYLNILKIDLLGLSTMTVIRHCLEQVDMTVQDLYDLPLDDEKVIDGFRQNDVVGIFQFDGRAMRSVNAELQPDSFKEICDVNALARPGPLHNNASAEYIDVKRGRKEPRRIHPMLDGICGDTHYQVVYQEQILRIVREIGNFDWTHAAYIRKIISRKIGEQEFNRQWDRFWKGARENGLTEKEAKDIWGLCITAGSYAFNAAHCVSYGMIAYWTMWLKVYHPLEFFAASLTKLPKNKHLELMRDAAKHDIKILPPDPDLSGIHWRADHDRNAILAGFAEVPGIGEKQAAAIMEYRREDNIEWEDLTAVKGIGRKTVEKIEEFVRKEDPFEIFKLDREIEAVKREIHKGKLGPVPWPTHTSAQVPYSRGDDTEVVWLGTIIHRNLRELFEVNFSRTGQALDPDTVKDPHLNEWVIMVGNDGTELLTITISRWDYPKYRDAIWGMKPGVDLVLVRGTKKGYQSRRAIYASRMWVISPEDEEE